MIDERLEARACLHALGALPPAEAREFELSLASQPHLAALVRELRATAHAMAAAHPQVTPPSQVKHGLLAALAHRPPAVVATNRAPAETARAAGWLLWMPWAMTGCFALLCVALIAIGHRLREQAVVMQQRLASHVSDQAELQRQLAQWQASTDTRTSNYEHRLVQTEQRAAQRIQDLQRQSGILSNQFLREQAALRGELAITRDRAETLAREKQVLEEALGGSALLNQQRLGSARIAVLRPTADGPVRALGAAVWLPTDRRGLLVLEAVPPPHASQDYQLWLADPNAPAPVSGGVFRPDPNGAVRLEFTSTQAAQVDRFWVTLEAKGGALRPAGKTLLAGP